VVYGELGKAGSRNLQLDVDLLAEAGGHVDERVDGELFDAAAEEIVDARLRDAAVFCGCGLCPLLVSDEFANLNHQLGTSLEVCGLFGRNAKRLPDGVEAFDYKRLF
jgi:hypothetical protein